MIKHKENLIDKMFPKGICGWKPLYAIMHPWLIIEKWNLEIKWASQRVFRGYDDRVIWSIDWYIANNLPKWLLKLKKNKIGVPTSMFEEEYYSKSYDDLDDVHMQQAHDKFDAILDQIIKGFQDYEKMNQVRYDSPKYKELKESFDNGFDLFREYFSNLWD